MTIAFFEQFKTRAELVEHIRFHSGLTATEFIKTNLPKEKVFQDAILKALRKWRSEGKIDSNALIWKNGAGVYNRNGLPDVCAIIDGRFFGFEVKRPFVGVVSGIQKKTIADIKAAGGVAAIVSYSNEVQQIIKDGGYWQSSKKPITYCLECEYWHNCGNNGICTLLSCDIGTEPLDGCTLGRRNKE